MKNNKFKQVLVLITILTLSVMMMGLVFSDNNKKVFEDKTDYKKGDVVTYNGNDYILKKNMKSDTKITPDKHPELYVQDINNEYKQELKNMLKDKYSNKELKGYNVIDVQSSVKVISYDITIQDKNTGEQRKVTWLVKN